MLIQYFYLKIHAHLRFDNLLVFIFNYGFMLNNIFMVKILLW